jgi:hypothetical protein
MVLKLHVGWVIPGPKRAAMLKPIGRIKNALEWYFFSFTFSAIIVRIIPTVPLMAPPNDRQNTACANDVE